MEFDLGLSKTFQEETVIIASKKGRDSIVSRWIRGGAKGLRVWLESGFYSPFSARGRL
jgi:hypothetical protein